MGPELCAPRPPLHRDDTLIPHPDSLRLGYAGRDSMAQPAEQLVGRTAELGAIDAALADLERGTFGALELAGEPGIGKTRLLTRARRAAADARGHLVLTGSASEFEATCRSGSSSTRSTSTSRLSSRGRLRRPRRTRRAPSSADVLPVARRPRGSATARRRALPHAPRGPRSCSRRSRATKPLVLLLDDLHWADSGVGRAARRAAPPSAGRGGAARVSRRARARSPERLAGALDALRRRGLLTRLELAA